MDWIDAHCHLSDLRLQARIPEIIAECAKAGIHRFVLGGVEPEEWPRQAELSRRYPGRIAQVYGLHPWWVHDVATRSASAQQAQAVFDRAIQTLEPLLKDCAALGETGLDGARDRFKRSRSEQVALFEAQLVLAGRHAKPLVLHFVRAHALALEILGCHRAALVNGGLVHSFSGTWADARRYLDLGLTLSISARVTFPEARDLHETVQKAPADRLVFETDSPDQPPFGSPTPVHTPLSLLKVVQQVSAIRSEAPAVLLDRSADNLRRLLRI